MDHSSKSWHLSNKSREPVLKMWLPAYRTYLVNLQITLFASIVDMLRECTGSSSPFLLLFLHLFLMLVGVGMGATPISTNRRGTGGQEGTGGRGKPCLPYLSAITSPCLSLPPHLLLHFSVHLKRPHVS